MRPLGSLLATLSLLACAAAAQPQTLDCEGVQADSPICRERQEALDGRARLEALREQLSQVQNPPWDPAAMEEAEALHQDGLALYRQERFGDAAGKFAPAIARMQAIDAQFQATKAARLAAGQALLEAEDFAAAATEFQAVADWLPDAPEVAAGLTAARQGMQAQAKAEEANRIAALDAEARFQRLMSEGFKQLDQGNWAEAERAFAEALALKPGAQAAQEALADARHRRANAALGRFAEQLQSLLQAERWADAQTLLESLPPDGPERAGNADTLARVTHLAQTEQRIDNYLAQPARISGKAAREAVRALLDATGNASAYGARIAQKRTELQRQLVRWTRPARLNLRSDGRTEVRIAPGRVLGKFRQRTLQVFPGRYVLRGHRSGFREVRMELDIPPGAPALAAEIYCHERF